MVHTPGQYRWSSYRRNAQRKEDRLLVNHPLYLSMGRTVVSRLEAYKAMFKEHIDEQSLNKIRTTLQTGTPLSSDRFKEKIKIKVGQSRCGRPESPKKWL